MTSQMELHTRERYHWRELRALNTHRLLLKTCSRKWRNMSTQHKEQSQSKLNLWVQGKAMGEARRPGAGSNGFTKFRSRGPLTWILRPCLWRLWGLCGMHSTLHIQKLFPDPVSPWPFRRKSHCGCDFSLLLFPTVIHQTPIRKQPRGHNQFYKTTWHHWAPGRSSASLRLTLETIGTQARSPHI